MEFIQPGDESFLRKLTELTEANLENEQFGVSELALEVGMSRSNLHRKVKSIASITVSQFIRRIRLTKALELLRETSLTIAEVAYESGFHSVTYFTKCFSDHYGYPPGKYIKTEEAESNSDKSPHQPRKIGFLKNKASKTWIIAAMAVIISGLLLLQTIKPFADKQHVPAKSLAVLPFRDDSPETDNTHIINGFMEEILHNLALIEEFSVVSRTSVEKYRNTDESIFEIGRDLNVNYILEGSAQSFQDKTVIRLQLIDVLSDTHLWSKPYKVEITLENFFDIQEEVALAVANELKVVLAPKEIKQLEKIPTENIAAYNLYMLGKEFLNTNIYSVNSKGMNKAMLDSKHFLEQAIELDSTFTDAYALLASIYIINLYYSEVDFYHPEARGDVDKANSYLDSGLVMLDKALFYDKDNPEALACKAAYYETKGMHEEATRIFETLSKNGHLTIEAAVSRYYHIEDYYNAIDSYVRYLRSKPADIIVPPYLLRIMTMVFRKTGFPELEKQTAEQLLSFNTDSLEYLNNMVLLENWQGNYQAGVKYGLEIWSMDSTDSHCNLILALNYAYLNNLASALEHVRIYENTSIRMKGIFQPTGFTGYIYLINGKEEEAYLHYQGVISNWQKQFEFNTPLAQESRYLHELADVYLALGEKEKAMEYLRVLKTLPTIDLVHITTLKSWPGFDIIRNEPEFLDVLKVIEATYQKEHTRIEKLLIREGMIKS